MERYPGLTPIPERIRRLEELACDLWWSWHYRARDLFRRLDYRLWRETAHNPVRMLRLLGRDRLERAAGDRGFLAMYDSVVHDLDLAGSAKNTWWSQRYGPAAKGAKVAYFSAEFALHQSLPLYAGGLGVLAGDTCKEASDLGVPLWWASGSCTRRGTSTSTSRPTGGNRKPTSASTGSTRRSSQPCAPTAPRAWSPWRSAIGRCSRRSGWSVQAG